MWRNFSIRGLRQGFLPTLRSAPRTHYDAVATAWKLILGQNFHFGYFGPEASSLAQATEALTEELATWGGLARGTKLLDVGCGVGGPAQYLHRRFGCSVIGVTISETELDLARKGAAAEGVSFIRGDILHNDLPGGAFDVVWIMESSHLMIRKGRLLREARRLLAPGGALLLCDIILRREFPLLEKLRYLARARPPLASVLFSLRRAFARGSLQTLASYERALEASGFHLPRTRDVSARVQPTMGCWRENIWRHNKEVLNTLSPQKVQDFLAASFLLEDLFEQGIYGYGLVRATRL